MSILLHAAISVLPLFEILYPVRFQCHLSFRAAERSHRSATLVDVLWKMHFTHLLFPHFLCFAPALFNPKLAFSFHFGSFFFSYAPSSSTLTPTSLPPTLLPLFFLCILCNWGNDPAPASSGAWLLFLSHHPPQCQTACRHSEVHLSFAFCKFTCIHTSRVTCSHWTPVDRLAQCPCMQALQYLHVNRTLRLVAYIIRVCQGITFLHKAEEEYRRESANVQHCSHSNLLQAG